MKRKIILALISGSIGAGCIVHKDRVAYEFPTAMSETVRVDYIKQWQKGKALYDINCAGCHNTTSKGRTIIPDFSQEKLVGYELRVSNARHENSMPDTKVTAEELGLIMTFLSYKKKNG